jgi:hypothetical protein
MVDLNVPGPLPVDADIRCLSLFLAVTVAGKRPAIEILALLQGMELAGARFDPQAPDRDAPTFALRGLVLFLRYRAILTRQALPCTRKRHFPATNR